MNLYAYAGNNPVTFSDPFGLCPPCGLGDVLTLRATVGGQVGGSVVVGRGVGAVGHVQVGPVVGVELSATGADVIETENELSMGAGLTAFGAEGGMKIDLLADRPVLFGETALKSLDVGHSSAQRDGRGIKTTVSVSVGVGVSMGVNWEAVGDLIRQAKDKLTGVEK